MIIKFDSPMLVCQYMCTCTLWQHIQSNLKEDFLCILLFPQTLVAVRVPIDTMLMYYWLPFKWGEGDHCNLWQLASLWVFLGIFYRKLKWFKAGSKSICILVVTNFLTVMNLSILCFLRSHQNVFYTHDPDIKPGYVVYIPVYMCCSLGTVIMLNHLSVVLYINWF